MKRQKKKYESPKFPWRKDLLESELKLLGTYGLRNKRELRRYKYILSKIRKNARELLGKTGEEKKKRERELLNRLYNMGILSENATLDDVLNLTVEDLLERRLHTLVYKLGYAKTINQARQLIVHGHVRIGERRVTAPGYLVKRGGENQIRVTLPIATEVEKSE